MKNSKTATYALAVFALLVWTVVAVQIVRWIIPEKEICLPGTAEPPREVTIAPVALKMDYADPFIKELVQRESTVKHVGSTKVAAEPTDDDNIPPPVIYKGLMTCQGMRVAMVMKGGTSIMLRDGDKVSGFTVKDITYDELVLERKAREYRLKIR